MAAWSNVPVYISFLSSSLFLKIVRFLQHLCAYWSLIAQGPKQLSFLRWAPYIECKRANGIKIIRRVEFVGVARVWPLNQEENKELADARSN